MSIMSLAHSTTSRIVTPVHRRTEHCTESSADGVPAIVPGRVVLGRVVPGYAVMRRGLTRGRLTVTSM